MKYIGSKRSIAKLILPYMQNDRQSLNRWWVEPFVGGANMIDKVTGLRLGNDINCYLIALLKAVSQGWHPPMDVSAELYYQVKNNKDKYPPELVGFIGFGCTFGAKWYAGYAKNYRKGKYVNRAAESARSLIAQQQYLSGVEFRCGSYLELEIPDNSLIYCDPPYRNNEKRLYGQDFNHAPILGLVQRNE